MDSSEVGRFGTLCLMKRLEPDKVVAAYPIDDEEMERIVTTIVAPGNCIGCHACGMVCGATGAQTHVAATA